MGARVMILAGGTGGHVYPALAVAEELRERGCEIRWMGTAAGLEARVVPAAGFPMDSLAVGGFRGKGWVTKLGVPFRLLRACWQAARYLRRFRPQVVLGMGGFVAAPGGVMAKLLGIPLVIHEQNRIPGTTNRFLVNCAHTVLEAFPGSFGASAGARAVGNPLRRGIVAGSAQGRKGPGSVINLLVVGGSLGAQALNRTVPEALVPLAGTFRIRHQTGAAMQAETEARYRELGIDAQVVAFIEEMEAAYRWADLAICRAGAMTISELAAMGLPAVLVPFPYAIDDHQTANARYLADQGAAVLLPQSDLTPPQLSKVLRSFSSQPEALQDLSRRLRSLAQLGATAAVCDAALAEAVR
ncbi:MAG: undecaprenyldiphospho-muramoylpentapeptide beta-N-acetylglucosaminyltransferase [Methylococcaceae bacterium]|nr:undecaprenyldiphospho-muramoylpentapeptide beta-N-acetylglucosaminyltransferase [Methylococcaceae bacterium]